MNEKDFDVRPMSSGQAQELSKSIETLILSLPYYNDFAKASEIAKYTPSLLKAAVVEEPDSVLVALSGQRIIGFCISKYDDGLTWLSWIAVDPSCRKLGVATRLLFEMESVSKKKGIHKIWCDCRTANEPSKTMLMRSGYRQICTVEKHWYGQDFILWEKPICQD